MLEFLFAVFAVAALLTITWGIGSAMMNGLRYSSFGYCLFFAVVFALLAIIINGLAGL